MAGSVYHCWRVKILSINVQEKCGANIHRVIVAFPYSLPRRNLLPPQWHLFRRSRMSSPPVKLRRWRLWVTGISVFRLNWMEIERIMSPEGRGDDKDLRTKGYWFFVLCKGEEKNRSQLGAICLLISVRFADWKFVILQNTIWFRWARIQCSSIAAQILSLLRCFNIFIQLPAWQALFTRMTV